MTDVWTSVGVIVGVRGGRASPDVLRLDPLIAMAVALNIVYAGLQLIGSSAMGLLDAALPGGGERHRSWRSCSGTRPRRSGSTRCRPASPAGSGSSRCMCSCPVTGRSPAGTTCSRPWRARSARPCRTPSSARTWSRSRTPRLGGPAPRRCHRPRRGPLVGQLTYRLATHDPDVRGPLATVAAMPQKSPKDFFRPLAVGAPAPLTEIPARPSRAIHFFDPSNEKMAAKVPGMVGTVDVLLGNLEDAVKADRKEAAREGLVRIGSETDFGPTQLWTRINALDSPWVLDDLTTPGAGDRPQARRDHGPEGPGPRGHPLRRPDPRPAGGEGRAGAPDPGPRDPGDRPRRGQRRGDLRGQPADAGPLPGSGRPGRRPPDEDHARRRRPPRLPGPPGSGRRRDRRARGRRSSRICGTTRSPGWSTPARPTASTRTTGPFGDIADVVACEDQFRNAFLLGCVGTWTLHPKQIAIANRVFAPSVADITHARRVVAAMGDGTGAVMLDGKMEDDASLKQCLVMVRLAEELVGDRPRAARPPTTRSTCPPHERTVPPPPLGALHAGLQRARAGEGQDDRVRRPDPRPRGRRRTRRQAGRPRRRVRGGEVR